MTTTAVVIIFLPGIFAVVALSLNYYGWVKRPETMGWVPYHAYAPCVFERSYTPLYGANYDAGGNLIQAHGAPITYSETVTVNSKQAASPESRMEQFMLLIQLLAIPGVYALLANASSTDDMGPLAVAALVTNAVVPGLCLMMSVTTRTSGNVFFNPWTVVKLSLNNTVRKVVGAVALAVLVASAWMYSNPVAAAYATLVAPFVVLTFLAYQRTESFKQNVAKALEDDTLRQRRLSYMEMLDAGVEGSVESTPPILRKKQR